MHPSHLASPEGGEPEIKGVILIALLSSLSVLGNFGKELLERHGIGTPDPGSWYSRRLYLECLQEIEDQLGPNSVFAAGFFTILNTLDYAPLKPEWDEMEELCSRILSQHPTGAGEAGCLSDVGAYWIGFLHRTAVNKFLRNHPAGYGYVSEKTSDLSLRVLVTSFPVPMLTTYHRSQLYAGIRLILPSNWNVIVDVNEDFPSRKHGASCDTYDIRFESADRDWSLREMRSEEKSAVYRLVLEDALSAQKRERQRSEDLLRNILPVPIIEKIKRQPGLLAEEFTEASVLFADLVNFTGLSSRIPPEKLIGLLDDLFSRFDAIADRYGIEKIKTIGDCYMAVAGVPVPCADHSTLIARMALDMQSEMERFNAGSELAPLALRIGVHSGPAIAGIIGKKKFAYDLWGDTVNTASRMESHGEPGRIHCSSHFKACIEHAFSLEPSGGVDVKGKGWMETWFLNT